jgi:hypothetical protein
VVHGRKGVAANAARQLNYKVWEHLQRTLTEDFQRRPAAAIHAPKAFLPFPDFRE